MSKVLEHGLLLPIIMGAIVVLTCAMRLASKIITAQMASSEKTAEFTRTVIKEMHARYMEVTRASGQAAAPPPPPGGVPAGHQPTARTEEEIIQMAEVLLLLRQRRAASEKGRQASGAEFVAGNGHLGANFHSGGENI